jgi:murein DD-endopeptidase MepM/ murein hydrolase activator NlpD
VRLRAIGLALAAIGSFSLLGHAAPHEKHTLPVAPVPPPPANASSPALALAALDRKIADLDAEEDACKKELAQLGTRLAEAHHRSLLRGRAYYKITRAGMLPVGGGFDSLVTHALRSERARRALAADLAEERRLRGRGAELSHALERVARDRVTYGGQRSAIDSARMAMADEVRRAAAFDRAFSTSTGASSEYVAVYGANGAAPADVSSRAGFLAAKGRLLFPVIGRAEVKPTKREGTDGPGLEVRAAMGTPVRAVFPGRVAFADRYGPYGRLVILDHGEHYYTISGNLQAIDVKPGAEITAGERIGSVGDEGHGPMLYFEIRHGTETIPPSAWLGL